MMTDTAKKNFLLRWNDEGKLIKKYARLRDKYEDEKDERKLKLVEERLEQAATMREGMRFALRCIGYDVADQNGEAVIVRHRG